MATLIEKLKPYLTWQTGVCALAVLLLVLLLVAS